MKNDGPEIQYLREVLGVEAIFASASNEGISVRPVQYRLAFFSGNKFSEVGLQLVEKMAAAVGCPDYFVAPDLDSETLSGRGVQFVVHFGETSPLESIRQLGLPAVDRFLDESKPAETKRVKKEAWEKLKDLKIQLEGLR